MSRVPKRSGLFSQPEKPTPRFPHTREEAEAAWERKLKHLSLAETVERNRSYVERIETEALDILGRHGLASEQRGMELRMLIDRVEKDHPADSEVGFAILMVRALKEARWALDEAERRDDLSMVRAFEAGLDLENALARWVVEFDLARLIEPAQRHRAGSEAGAKKRRGQGEAVREAARAYAAEFPKTSHGALANHVAVALDRDKRSVQRATAYLFEARPGGRNEKRLRKDWQTLD